MYIYKYNNLKRNLLYKYDLRSNFKNKNIFHIFVISNIQLIC